MNALQHVFLEPLDVLYLRGNRSFGEAGDHAAAQMPPWPSLAAGALRSRMLADANIAPGQLENAALTDPQYNRILGTYENPGAFRLVALHLARRLEDGSVQTFHPSPADLWIPHEKTLSPALLRPAPTALPSSYNLNACPLIPALPAGERDKPASRWLTDTGWRAYLAGTVPSRDDTLTHRELWRTDARIGIGLDSRTRSAEEGKIFSTDAVAPARHVGLLATIFGAEDKAPRAGMVRLGGDGRAAALAQAGSATPEPDYDALARARRLRIVLTSPAAFPGGWRPPSTLGGRLAAAAVPRAQVISGWDLVRRESKPAERFVPAGAVYWLDGITAAAEELRRIAIEGLWPQSLESEQRRRRAEGFNALTLAAWPES